MVDGSNDEAIDGDVRMNLGDVRMNLARLGLAVGDARRQLEYALSIMAEVKGVLTVVPEHAVQVGKLDKARAKISLADKYLNSCLSFQSKLDKWNEENYMNSLFKKWKEENQDGPNNGLRDSASDEAKRQ